jgi:hypothetical protein
MTESQNKAYVGDTKTPALQATESALRTATEGASQAHVNTSSMFKKSSVLGSLASALKAENIPLGSSTNCAQVLWFSFFFDGTGNNLKADLGMRKHSNVARLFRVHRSDEERRNIYRIYIPGVGTYFREIGDDGGGMFGLGCGAMGEKRLYFALGQFDKLIAPHVQLAQAPANAIKEINIAVFGFSRGAALARAFANLLIESRCDVRGENFVLRRGAWQVRFRFMGLFDTVASVGQPMSRNNTGVVNPLRSNLRGMISDRLEDYLSTRPEELAFSTNGRPGADPAPGRYAGHDDWGGRLKINEKVEEVRHFIAAHEIRNSFPLDSISMISEGKILKPSHFYETVYPGAHSDVGGGYAAGEGARGLLPTENLALIPLRDMYNYAIRHGVPMLPETAWKDENTNDFSANSELVDAYNSYANAIGAIQTLGNAVNKSMSIYFAWRFRAIRMRAAGDKTEEKLIRVYDEKFRQRETGINSEIKSLAQREDLISMQLDFLRQTQDIRAGNAVGMREIQEIVRQSDQEMQDARRRSEKAHDELLWAKARKDTLPNMSNLPAMLELYDARLLADVQAIRTAMRHANSGGRNRKREELRPYYRALLEAFENEFEKGSGLTDRGIINFFDNYVHDSLAGFARDATLPSDPRVIYLGKDEKLRFAMQDSLSNSTAFS